MKDTTVRKGLDRTILATYLAALFIIMVVPISARGNLRFLGIGADKWVHFGMFCGLAALFRWNLSGRYPWLVAAMASVCVAVLTEAVQSAISYRGASWSDLYADVAGVVLGVAAMSRIMALPRPEKVAGATVMVLGLGVAGLFVLADVLGLGENPGFGPTQVGGTFLGVVVAAGGLALSVIDRFTKSRAL